MSAVLGYMPMPRGFKYAAVFFSGRPEHPRTSPFRLRHPLMDVGKRAKIFAPFDALKGFSEAVSSKAILYEDRRTLNEEDLRELDRRLQILQELSPSRSRARENRICLKVTYFVPCTDPQNEAYEVRGRYETHSGILLGVDPEIRRALFLEDKEIPFRDLLKIESPQGIFN